MRIQLNRTGGIAGKRSSAVLELDLGAAAWKQLLEQIAIETPPVNKRKKDTLAYTLQADDGEAVLIDPNRVPEKYHALFKELFAALEPVA